jgi:hypothetical protein
MGKDASPIPGTVAALAGFVMVPPKGRGLNFELREDVSSRMVPDGREALHRHGILSHP